MVVEARHRIDDATAAVRADFARDLSAREWIPKLAGTACVAAGVRRIVQISALGADRGVTRYFLSKRAADDYLATLPLEWTIVRPALVFGAGGTNTRLFTTLARLPIVPLPGRGEQCVQPLYVDDLTEAVVRVLSEASLNRTRVHLVGPQSLTVRELIAGLRR